jgi:sigma-B regulation protein RsbU (phosphoserine phosphatase)
VLTFLRRHVSWVVAVVFGLGGPLTGLVAARLAGSVERERAFTACAEYFSEHETAFSREVHETTEEVFHLSSLFLVSRDVSREQFHIFSADVLARHPAIAALEWAPRVTAAERAAHESLGRAEGLGDYRVRSEDAGGTLVVSPAQSDYYPVFYVEPLAPNGQAVGVDLSSDRVRRAALRRAEVAREPTLTGPIGLVLADNSGKGFLELLPVFATTRTGHVSVSGAPDGFVVLVLRARDLFAQVLDEGGAGDPADMRFELIDIDVDGKPTLLEATRGGDRAQVYGNWQFARQIDIGGRQWRLTGRPTRAYVSRYLTRSPVILGVGVIVLWELVGGLALLLVARGRDAAFRRQTRITDTSLRSLTEGVVVADAAGRFVLFNDGAERLLGMEPRDVSMSEWSSTYGCFYPDGVTPFPSGELPLARAIRGEVSNADVFIRNQNVPQGVWINISGTPLRDERGAPDGGVVVFRDVTAARQAEDRLRASLKQLEDLRYAVDQASLVAITNHAGSIIEVNDKFCEVTGYSRDELIGQNHRILKSGYHPESFYHEMWHTISSGSVWRRRICNRAKDGHQFWVDTTIVPLLVDGEPERYLALRTDITEHMRQQAELVRLSNAVEQTADAIMITAPDGTIQYVNPAFEATTGYSRAEALGQTPRLLRSGKQPPEYYDALWKTILGGNVFRGSPINRRKNGDLFQAEQTITPIKDSEGRIEHFVTVIKDITDRIRVEQQELEIRYASDVQRRLYPIQPPTVPGLDIAAATFPALATCGDYYDYLTLPNGSIGVVIGDVSGHGLGPALIMVETRACLQFLSQTCANPGEVLTRMNATLYNDLDEERYVALILAQFDPLERRLVYANAGHTAAYHLDGRGNVKAVMESGGPPAGMIAGTVYGVTENPPIDDGDIVVFLTDGVTETEDSSGNCFGADAAINVIRDHLEASAQDLVRYLRDAARAFAGGAAQEDDITLLVCKKVVEVDPAFPNL